MIMFSDSPVSSFTSFVLWGLNTVCKRFSRRPTSHKTLQVENFLCLYDLLVYFHIGITKSPDHPEWSNHGT